jgi:hypothetical protein
MRRLLFIASVMLLVPAYPAGAATDGVQVSVTDLIQDAAVIQGNVVVQGELIGDYGFRRDGSMWTQLNGDSYVYKPVLDGGPLTGGNVGVAVRIPEAIARTLDKPGGYRVRGPLVEIVGEWKYHDPHRGGESYIDVLTLEVLEPGRGLVEHPDYWILASGLILIAAAAALRRGSGRANR